MNKILITLSCASLMAIAQGDLFAQAVSPDLPRPYKPVAENQLLNLHGKVMPAIPAVPEISWPVKPGEAEVCLWKGDKYAAASITIDDNWDCDYPWWLNLCSNLGIHATWFIITGQVDGRGPGTNGTWADYAKMVAAGHEVQAHTINHYGSSNPADAEKCRQEYAGSIRDIEKNIPGHRCVVLAYPMGAGLPDVASEYFIGARGIVGIPTVALHFNYMNTSIGDCSPGAIDCILGRQTPTVGWSGNPWFHRAWLQILYHGVDDKDKGCTAKDIENLASLKDQIWIETYAKVAKYAQERDSATLRTVAFGSDSIQLSLSDLMKDDIFDQPLTLKVRLPEAWKTLKATQGKSVIPSSIVMHEGKPFALVEGIPDRGTIAITAK